jgi:nitronate monooxygenase
MSIPNHIKNNLSMPVIGAPLFIISGPELVIAQCKAGVIGSFPAFKCKTSACIRRVDSKNQN